MIGGKNGLYTALALAVAMNFFGYFFSDKLALAMYSAQPVTPTENSDVYARVFPIVRAAANRSAFPTKALSSAHSYLPLPRSPNHGSDRLQLQLLFTSTLIDFGLATSFFGTSQSKRRSNIQP